MPLNFFFSAWDDYLADQAQGININTPVEHYFKSLPLPRFQGAEKTIAGNGNNIPETCSGCGTVQSCNLRIEGMADLCKGQQPAPEGSIRIGDTFVQIRKGLKKHYPAPNSFQWIEDPDTHRYEQRIKEYFTHQLGFAWIKKAAVFITDDEITITGAGQITIEQEDDEFAKLTIEGQRDLILNAKTTPNGEYWYINRGLIKRKVLRRLSDSKYIPEIALSNDREEEDKTTLEDYTATPFLDAWSDIPYWEEPEKERNLKPTQYDFGVVTRKQILRRLSDSKYIPEIALSNDREEEDKTTLEDYTATPFLDARSDIPYWEEPEEERNLKPTQYGFEVVTRKQRKRQQAERQEARQEKFLINHGFRLKDKLESLLKHNPDRARIMASKLSFKDWQALDNAGGLSPAPGTGKYKFK